VELVREKYQKLFSTPVLRYRVADPKPLNAALLEQANRMRLVSAGASKSNRGGWHSEGNIFDHDAAPMAQLRLLVLKALEDANGAIGAKADFSLLRLKLSGWMNANPKGAFNAPHSHPGAHWSGVYYVAQPEVEEGTSGMIEFLDARSDLPNWRILEAAPFRVKKKLRPQSGELILFPSYLVHWVYPNEADDERFSVAFNATYKRKRST